MGVGRFARTVASALAGVGAGLAFEPRHWVYLLPVAVAALTLLCAGRRLRSGLWLGWVFGTAFMLVLLPWLQVIGVYAWIPLAVLEGAFYGIAGLVTSAVARPGARLRLWPVWAASSWVLLEALRSTVPFGGFPWGRLSFAVEDTPVAPALAYVGAAGVTFLVAIVGTTLAWAVWRVRRAPVRSVVGLAVAVAVACLASLVPWHATRPTDPRVRVAAVQGNVPGTGLDAFVEQRVVLDNHVQATLRLAQRIDSGQVPRPDLVIWPENSSDIDPYADAAARAAIGDAAAAVQTPLLMGSVVGDRGDRGWYNRAIVWSPDGRPGAYYDKIHPVPFGEYIPLRSFFASRIPALRAIPSDMVRGTHPGVLQVGPARAGVLMCFEVAYDGLLRDLVDGGADLIVVPTNNATYTGTGQVEQQFAMSRLRAIETGRTVVVASTNGISGVVAPDGRVVARAPERRQVVLEREVTLVSRRTPATVLGRWPELALSALAVLALVVALVTGRRRRRSTPPGGPSTGVPAGGPAPVDPGAREGRPGTPPGSRPELRREVVREVVRRRSDDRRPAGPGAGRRPDLRRAGQPRVDRRPVAGRGAGRRRTGGRRRLARRHRRRRGPAGRRGSPGERAAPRREGRSGRGVPRRIPGGPGARLRRGRRDGRRRVPPARAAAGAAGRPRRGRPGDRIALGARRVGGQLAAVPQGALGRREPVCPAAARDPAAGHHGRLPAVPALRPGEHRPRQCRVGGLHLPDRPRVPVAAGGAAGGGGADRVRGAGPRRVQDEPGRGDRVAAPDHRVGAGGAMAPAPRRTLEAHRTGSTTQVRSRQMRGSTGVSIRRRVPWWVLVLLFVALPVLEIYVLIQIGQTIGAWWTVLLLVADGVLGGWLMKREGTRAWGALTTALRTGRMPTRELVDAALVLVGGTLLLTPGFVTDAFGLFLVLPFTRPVARRILIAYLTRRFLGPGGPAAGSRSGSRPGDPGDPWARTRRGPGPDGVVQGEVVD